MSTLKFHRFVGLVVVLALLGVTFTPATSARAAGPWYVSTMGDDTSDCLSPGTACATINGAFGKASIGDTINVAEGAYTGSGTEVVFINKDITLSGGWNSTFTTRSGMSTIDGQHARSGINLFGLPGATALIEYFIVQNGDGAGVVNNGATLTLTNSIMSNNSGGGIWSGGTLTLNNSVVINNTDGDGGGGIEITGGMAIINNTVVKDNTTSSYGGGIFNRGGDMTLNNTAVIGNQTTGSNGGGGILHCFSCTLTINNSTISGNTALNAGGGGILNVGTLHINNTTISNNTANDGGGINMNLGLATLQNTIIGGNTGGVSPDCYGTISSTGYNLIGNTSGCTFTASNGDLLNIDPLLGPLQDNGGFTLTHALLPGSPAIDAGNPAGCSDQDGNLLTTDQRDVTRPQGTSCDIGAFELEQVTILLNDDFDFATTISGLPFTAIQNTSSATTAGDDPDCVGQGPTVWYAFTPSQDMRIQANTFGSNYDTTLSAYTGSRGNLTQILCNDDAGGGLQSEVAFDAIAGQTFFFMVGAYSGGPGGILAFTVGESTLVENDNFANAQVIASLPFSATADITNAGIESGEVQNCDYLYQTIWYSFTPSENTFVRANTQGSGVYWTNVNVYSSSGPGMNNLNLLGCGFHGASFNFLAEAGKTYYLQVGPINNSSGSVQINLEEFFPPSNDNFAGAKLITSLPFSDSIDNTGATTESGENQYCYSSAKTVWYSFTPTANALVKADMQGSSFGDTIFNVYQSFGPGINNLSFMTCAYYGNSATFSVQAGVTYYIQAGSISAGGNLQFNLQEIPRPVNDDFANAKVVALPLPFDDTVDTQFTERQMGEPTPSCAYYGPGNRSVWYAFTPATSGSVSASIPSSAFTPVFAAYTGSSLTNLTQVGCQTYSGNLLTFHVNGGTTYYFQVGNLYPWEQGGSMQFHLDVAPQPVVGFYFYPSDPSKYDTIQFCTSSYDPGNVGFESFTWDFGDGATSTAGCSTHQYTADGDYTVQHTATTLDGRTASITQVVYVRTHDVGITRINAPQSASARQTRTITVSVKSKNYAETVRIDLYKSVAGGFEFIGSITQLVPAGSNRQTTAYNFSYTFTSSDASIGKVTFKAVATIVDARDSYPSDNEAISSPPTRVTR